MTVKLTDANFDSFLRNPVVVVDFWAEWCFPCKLMAPIVEELAKRYAGRIAFGKLNVDENPKTVRRFNINAIPTLLFFKNGELVEQVVGVMPKGEVEKRVEALLS